MNKRNEETVTIDPLRVLDENGEFPGIWSPEPGDVLKGVIRRYTETVLEKSGPAWVCTIQTSPDEVLSVFLTPTVLKGEFARKKPKVGERISIKFLGTPAGKSYKKYTVAMIDREDTGLVPDWDQMDPDQRNYVVSVPDDRPGTPYASTVVAGGKGGTAVAEKPVPSVSLDEAGEEDPFLTA